jgi:hypothetical protein
MSVDVFDADPVDIWQQTRLRARKEHRCAACKETIRRGDLYVQHKSLFDGSWETVKRCLRCDAMYKALDDKIHKATDGEEAADIRLACGHEYKKRWGEEPPPELARLAFMTADDMQAEALAQMVKP